MAEKKLYKEYFQIDPKYFPQVTEALIKLEELFCKRFVYRCFETGLRYGKRIESSLNVHMGTVWFW